MTTNHKYFLGLAFQIAKINLGKTNLNPCVGTIIVKNNSVISSGVTSIKGRPHAEYNALKIKNNYFGADLYTTLEPCTHYGHTPPCVNIIVKNKIKNVYYAFNDPDKRTYRKAKKILKDNNINSKQINIKDFKDFYSSYFFNKKYNLPFISAKIAISKDYYTINNKSKWITNNNSRIVAQLLRSRNDCIFSTSKTINKDNSQLNCRIDGFDKYKPDLFIIDLDLKLKKNLSIYSMLNKRKIFLLTTKKNHKKINFFKNKGLKIILIDSLDTKYNFKEIFQHIYKLGYSRVFFETGLTFLNSLIKHKLLNNLYVFQNNQSLKKNGSNNSSIKYLRKLKLNKKINVNLNGDSLYKINF